LQDLNVNSQNNLRIATFITATGCSIDNIPYRLPAAAKRLSVSHDNKITVGLISAQSQQ